MKLITALAGALLLAACAKPIVVQPIVIEASQLQKPLRYLIGTDGPYECKAGEIVEVAYGAGKPDGDCILVAYVNLFDEKNTGRYGPYLHNSDTAEQYNEGQIDPKGLGWDRNLRDQFDRKTANGFPYVELDNPDAYQIKNILDAIDLADSYGLKVIAKNPGITDDPLRYVAQRNVYGIIVEKGAGSPAEMDALRKSAGKPDLPVWFVSFGNGRAWAAKTAREAKSFNWMWVTYSAQGEYGSSADVN